MEDKCICEIEELYKKQMYKLYFFYKHDYGGMSFKNIKPNYCPICGRELPEEPDE